jgi:hypothetical protein
VPVTKGQMDSAIRRALNLFDQWNGVTGFVTEHTSYYYELQAVIEDAVHCGAQAALGIREPLESEVEKSAP